LPGPVERRDWLRLCRACLPEAAHHAGSVTLAAHHARAVAWLALRLRKRAAHAGQANAPTRSVAPSAAIVRFCISQSPFWRLLSRLRWSDQRSASGLEFRGGDLAGREAALEDLERVGLRVTCAASEQGGRASDDEDDQADPDQYPNQHAQATDTPHPSIRPS
jgi:hypothetical protein